MGAPSSQIMAVWVREQIHAPEWRPLREVLFAVVLRNWAGHSEEAVWECVEDRIEHVANDLRDYVAECRLDGAVLAIEIDEETPAYVRAISSAPAEIICKLRRIDPFAFEQVCADILTSLGAHARVTKKTGDGGVDFWASGLSFLQAQSV